MLLQGAYLGCSCARLHAHLGIVADITVSWVACRIWCYRWPTPCLWK